MEEYIQEQKPLFAIAIHIRIFYDQVLHQLHSI